MNEPKSELMAGLEDANHRTMSMEIAIKTAAAIRKLRRAERAVADAKMVLQWAKNRQAELCAQVTRRDADTKV
jgi:hypothetical protein